jgi:hypothetical protein
MFVTFDPEDGSQPQTWVFDPDDVDRRQGEDIEKAMGTIGGAPANFDAWLELVRGANMRARTVLLWHLLRLDHKSLAYKDTPNFKRRQLKVEMSVAELRELYERIGKTKMADETREAFEAAFDRDIAEAMERETGVISGEIEERGKAN